ncbi:hypothetical protein J6590_091927, partial [Homalodisca vitripennis]
KATMSASNASNLCLRSPLLPTATCIPPSRYLDDAEQFPFAACWPQVVAVVVREMFKSSTFQFTNMISFPAVIHNRTTWFNMLQNSSHKCSCTTVRYLNQKSSIGFPAESAKHPLSGKTRPTLFLRLIPNQHSDRNGNILSLRSMCQTVTVTHAPALIVHYLVS